MDKAGGMAADVGSDRHLGVGAGGVEALQACVESLFTHLKSVGAESTLAPLYPLGEYGWSGDDAGG